MARRRTSSPPSKGLGRVRVLLPLPLGGAYDYRVPHGSGALTEGAFVRVPLGSRETIGVVWGAAEGGFPAAKLKDVIAPLDCPPLGVELRRLIDWVAAYTLAPPGAVLRMAMSVREALQPAPPRIAYRATGAAPERLTEHRRRALAIAQAGPPRLKTELAREAAVSVSVIDGLVATGALASVQIAGTPTAAPAVPAAVPRLSPPQAAAATALAEAVARRGFSATLLDGVTGAGKTEVYFEAIAAALAAGRQALVLLPEIALTAQWLQRFAARFGAPPAQWHSDVRRAAKREVWRAAAEGRATVVVGARSALFLPFADLGLIVVDEEQDGAFKQEDGVVYNARDMAVVRARLAAVPIVLASATPSLETVVNANAGRYAHVLLPERHGAARLPEIASVDMRVEPPPRGQWLSPSLATALDETLAAGEQAMLFLNRRGYAPLTLCRACGHRLECPNCSAWLVEHRLAGRLQCHHCGHARALPESCPACAAHDRLAACGPGVERLHDEVAVLAPEARAAIVASDTLRGPGAAEAVIRRVTDHEIDVLIGTQVVAKGHNFPLLTLVGVVDADLGLGGGDLRAMERTYQLLHQVAGRAGRAERPGRVLLQTYMPEHPVMAALVSGDRDAFLAAEAAARRDQAMPPFGRLAALIVSGVDEAKVAGVARALGRAAPSGEGLRVLGPAPAPLSLLRGRHRHRLLLKTARAVRIQDPLRAWLAKVKVPASVRVQVDVDPYSFL